MRIHRILMGTLSALGLLALTGTASLAAVAHEPLPITDPGVRPLRSGYVRDWYIFNDSNTDGILDPGDTHAETFKNWWTPVSAHTQHNHGDALYSPGDDQISDPMNFATDTLGAAHPDKSDPNYNYWLPRSKNSIAFYMSYSQFDNSDWSGAPATTDGETIVRDRNMERNGFAFGWVTNDYQQPDGTFTPDQTPAGSVEMDIFVHKGEMTLNVDNFGVSRSNPQVATSNDLDYVLGQDNVGAPGQWQPPQFDEGTQTYSTAVNSLRMTANGHNDTTDLTALVDSMEIREFDPVNLPADPDHTPIWATRTPQQILNDGITDHNGLPYEYEDAFMDRSTYAEASTDGGVIAGLSGWDEYDPQVNNWGDQQVIRIDLSESTLLLGDQGEGNIDELIFYDFGDSIPGSDATQQVNPRVIAFGVDRNRTPAAGQIYLKDANTGDPVLYFPENRIYIARVVVPEPGTMLLIAFGGAALAMRRKATKTHV